jgi:hypothetical protein
MEMEMCAMKATGVSELTANNQEFKYHMDPEETGYKGDSGIGIAMVGGSSSRLGSNIQVCYKHRIS